MSFKKQDFANIYNDYCPTRYLDALGKLNYRNPDFFHASIEEAVARILENYGSCKVIDVACSYGFNGAIAKSGTSFYAHSAPRRSTVRPEVYVIGIDVASNAVEYALTNKHIDYGILQNLETEPLADIHRSVLADADLIIASGAFSYITVKTLKALYEHINEPTEFIGWPHLACETKEIIAYLQCRHDSVELSELFTPMRNFEDSNERSSFQQAVLDKGYEARELSTENLTVYKIHAR